MAASARAEDSSELQLDNAFASQVEQRMRSSKIKRKSAMDALLDSVRKIVKSDAEKMDSAQRRESEERFNEILDRAVASRKRRRQTT